MGLRCSLLGHTFDEQAVAREREDRGSEVLTVIREIERCSRCGAERVVSESTEITSVADAEEVGADQEPTRQTGGDRPASGPGGPGGSGTAGGAGGTGGAGTGGHNAGSGPGVTDEMFEPPGDPAEEDAEILDDGEERAPGEWPDDAAGEDADESPDADEPTGSSTSDVRSQGGGEIIDADGTTGGTPDASPDASTDTSGDVSADVSADAGEADAADAEDETREYEEESAFEPMGSSVTVPEGHYECPDCGHTEGAESSFRDGDACPNCREGYLEHREGT